MASLILTIATTPKPPLPTSALATVCNTATSTINSGAVAFKYNWSISPSSAYTVLPGDTNASLNIDWNNTYTGSVQIRVSVLGNCGNSENSDPLIVNLIGVPAKPITPVTQTTTLCANLTSYISTNQGEQKYLWNVSPSNAGFILPEDTLFSFNMNWNDVFPGGMAKVWVTAQNQCGSSRSDTLKVNLVPLPDRPNLPVSIGQTTLCINSPNSILNTNTGLGQYKWRIIPSNAGLIIDSSFTVPLDWYSTYSGQAKVQVAAYNLCGIGSYSDTLFFTINPKIPTSIIDLDTSYCQKSGQTINLVGIPSGGVFKVNSAISNIFPISSPGTFRIKYELAGCYDTSGKWVKVNPRTTPVLGILDTVYCQSSQPVAFTGIPGGGQFMVNNGIIAGTTFIPNQTGNFQIGYTMNTCSDTSRKFFIVKPAPVASISSLGNIRFCQDTTLVPLNVTPAGGQLLVNSIPSKVFRPQTPGLNQLVYTVKVGSCISKDTLSILVDIKPTISFVSFGSKTVCGFDTLIPLYFTPKGGIFNSSAVVDSSLNPRFLASGNQTITYSAFNGVCKDSASLIFNILPVPLVNVGLPDTICQFSQARQMVGFSPAGGFWSGTNISSSGSFNPVKPGSNQVFYKIAAQTGFSCAGKASKLIFVIPKPKLDLPIDASVCEGSKILLNPLYAQAVQWKWHDGSSKPFFQASEPGDYFVELKDKFCTWSSDTFTLINKFPLPKFSFGKDSIACFNNPVQLKGPSNMAGYEWTLLDSNEVISTDSVFEMTDPMAVKLTVISKTEGCYFTDGIIVIEKLCEEIHIPEAFSPNGDGENDFWKLYGVNTQKILVKIYNEWGECVFYSEDKADRWDGTYKVKKCKPGAYQYIVEYSGVTPRGRSFNEKKDGIIYLIK